jgi:N-acetylmuramoyl-L-alanine amidase
MRTIFIGAGHSNTKGRDMGAVGNGYVEGELTVELRNLVIEELAKLGIKAERDGDNSVTLETVNFIRKKLFKPDSILVDIHFNAGPAAATGCEVIIPASFSVFERDLADELSALISTTLQIRNRGRKTEAQTARKQLAWMRMAGDNILPEICFISNADDMSKYQAKKKELAYNMAALLKKWSSK